MKKYKILITVTGVIILFAIFSAVVVDRSFKAATTVPSKDQVEKFIDHSLPETAYNEHFFVIHFMDTQSYVKFTANSDEIKRFLENIGFEFPLSRSYGEYFSEWDFDQAVDELQQISNWWDISLDDDLVGGSISNYDIGKAYSVGVKEISDTEWTVYMIVGTTP